MITVHVLLDFYIFTKDVKSVLDEALKELPLGSRVFVEIVDNTAPFTLKEKEQQIVACYSPSDLETITFGIPDGPSVDVKTKVPELTTFSSAIICEDLIVYKNEVEARLDPRVFALVSHWKEHNQRLIEYLILL